MTGRRDADTEEVAVAGARSSRTTPEASAGGPRAATGDAAHETTSSSAPPVDLDGLLVALVLVPHSYARNRFFGLFRRPEAARVRRRAALLRSVIAELQDEAIAVSTARREARVVVRYALPELGGRRESHLSEDEFALVAMVLHDARPALGGFACPEAQARITPSLERLFVSQVAGPQPGLGADTGVSGGPPPSSRIETEPNAVTAAAAPTPPRDAGSR